MQELITITEQDGKQIVSARDLHRFLEIETPLTIWMPRMLDYGFEDGKDFVTFLLESTGGRPLTNYALTLDTAKEISMIRRSDKGKQARRLRCISILSSLYTIWSLILSNSASEYSITSFLRSSIKTSAKSEPTG